MLNDETKKKIDSTGLILQTRYMVYMIKITTKKAIHNKL
jgi:hypothetical protein